MAYEIIHSTTYDYSGLVSLSHHMLRLQPMNSSRQKCERHELQINPPPTLIQTHFDYYGNAVEFITIERPHQVLEVKSSSRVATFRRRLPPPLETPEWESVRDFCRGEQIGSSLEASEFIFDSPLIRSQAKYADYAAPSFGRDRPILDATLDLTRRIHRDFKFDPTATTIATPLEEVFKARRGVCQDFAHFQIACLRSLGLPARYVSGYLETDPPPGQPRLEGTDASHAWVSIYCHGFGWIDADPTNGLLPDTRHISLAFGRDYDDVSPIRGVVRGGGDHTLEVAVDVVSTD